MSPGGDEFLEVRDRFFESVQRVPEHQVLMSGREGVEDRQRVVEGLEPGEEGIVPFQQFGRFRTHDVLDRPADREDDPVRQDGGPAIR